MRLDTPTDVDRGAYPDAVTPWDQEDWRREALDWVGERLTGHGLRASGTPSARVRPWSLLMRVPVDGDGTVWFKANPPASRFEAPLTAALADWVPGRVLRPLAVEAGRGWSLLPHGGPLLRTVLETEPVEPRAWEDLLQQYATTQRALVPHTDAIERLGVQRIRTTELPTLFDALLAASGSLEPADRARLTALRPRLVDWCAELAALGIPDSLDHADLHEGQVFRPEPGRYTFFDWGDAVVSHPFNSLRVPGRQVEQRYGAEVLPRLRDAYLEPWTGDGHTAAELRRAARIAWRLGVLGRVRSWGGVFPSATPLTAVLGGRALLELLEEPPFR
ncbi:phosphotransferase [Streptomyces sp. NPDC059597]|uniref:phosphotransferase n=1 Tax=Streptomyces sp. NPDC059597 TaxID=3346879 RepID=UPI00369418CF